MKATVIIDTREKEPFAFSDAVGTVTGTLAVGDYSLRGFEEEITIERKSLPDLLASVTHGRERFEKELRRMRAFRFAAIVVECSWADVIQRRYRADVHPNAVIGSLQAFALRYGVQIVMGEDRATAARLTERLLVLFARRIESDWKTLASAGGEGDA